MSEDIRRRIVDEARALLGTPWVHQHRAGGQGIDCAGVLTVVGRRLGLTDFDMTSYGRLPDGNEMLRLCDEHMTRIPASAMQLGDVAVLRFDRGPQHIGIVGDYLYGGFSLIHASSTVGKVVEHRLTPDWRGKIVAVYRAPGVPE